MLSLKKMLSASLDRLVSHDTRPPIAQQYPFLGKEKYVLPSFSSCIDYYSLIHPAMKGMDSSKRNTHSSLANRNSTTDGPEDLGSDAYDGSNHRSNDLYLPYDIHILHLEGIPEPEDSPV
jgi:hypothetical protein